MALPTILYGMNIINLTDTEIQKLQTLENRVYRKIHGAPKYAPNCTLRGEIGSSRMKERIINGRVQYLKRALDGANQLLKRIMEEQIRYRNTGWIKTTLKHMNEVSIHLQQLSIENKEQVKEKIKNWDTGQ